MKMAQAETLGRWIAILVGAFTLIGVLVGAGINYGQHLKADTDQDALIQELRSEFKTFDARLDMLERAHDQNSPADVSLYVNHAHTKGNLK